MRGGDARGAAAASNHDFANLVVINAVKGGRASADHGREKGVGEGSGAKPAPTPDSCGGNPAAVTESVPSAACAAEAKPVALALVGLATRPRSTLAACPAARLPRQRGPLPWQLSDTRPPCGTYVSRTAILQS